MGSTAPEGQRYPKHGPLLHEFTLCIDDVHGRRFTLPLDGEDMVQGVGTFVTRYADDARTIEQLINENEIRQFGVERRDEPGTIFLVGNLVSTLLTVDKPCDEHGVTFRAFDGELVTVIANNAKVREQFEITIRSVPDPGRGREPEA